MVFRGKVVLTSTGYSTVAPQTLSISNRVASRALAAFAKRGRLMEPLACIRPTPKECSEALEIGHSIPLNIETHTQVSDFSFGEMKRARRNIRFITGLRASLALAFIAISSIILFKFNELLAVQGKSHLVWSELSKINKEAWGNLTNFIRAAIGDSSGIPTAAGMALAAILYFYIPAKVMKNRLEFLGAQLFEALRDPKKKPKKVKVSTSE